MPPALSRLLRTVAWPFRRNTLESMTEMAQQRGDAVAFSLGGLRFHLMSHPDAIRETLVTQADAFTKAPALQRSKSVLGEGLLTSEGDFHRRQRRLSQPAFHPKRVADYAPLMVDYAQRIGGTWHDGETIDVHEQMMRLALQIVAKSLFGGDVENEVEPIGAAMDVMVRMFTRMLSPWGRVLNVLPLPSNFRCKRAISRVSATIDRFIAQRRADRAGRDDLLSMLLNARDEERDNGAMTDLQLRDECLTLFTAGHETTANALTFTFYLLSQNAAAEAELHEELDRVQTMDVEQLVFTRAVIAESMRLYPPAWAVARQAKQDVEICGEKVARGEVVLMSQWVVHRDGRWWPRPEQFDPHRWLPVDPSRPRWAYFPFGGGPRACIGEAFAWTEATLALATLARQWRIRVLDPRPPKLLPTITLRPRDGMPAVVSARASRCLTPTAAYTDLRC